MTGSSASGKAAGSVLVIGVGTGLGASLCCALGAAGYKVAAIGRTLDRKSPVALEIGKSLTQFRPIRGDVTREIEIAAALTVAIDAHGPPSLVFYNAAQVHFALFSETSPEIFERLWRINCLGAMLCARQILPAMAEQGHGSMIFAGATASVKGGASASAFASSKFALRGMVQSLAREYGPKGVHVAHAILDGKIENSEASRAFRKAGEENIDPDDVAATLLMIAAQSSSAWTQELDMRPYAEIF